jgi:hypothetical protein
MVFISKNLIRKCKYCELPAKLNMSSGRNKGYYRTCGNEICLKEQYKDKKVSIRKGRILVNNELICVICSKKFKRISANHKCYCKECVPDKSWRGRANRYNIGKPQWDDFLLKQNNVCALCYKIPEVVDHCHKSGNVRGLLCNGCNLQIAKMDNDKEWLLKAIKYIGD